MKSDLVREENRVASGQRVVVWAHFSLRLATASPMDG